MARVLIVEDEMLIAMLLEEWVVELGHQPIGPADAVAKALELINDTAPDVAIVDYHLKGETSDPVAAVLRARNVPFAFASGESVLDKTTGLAHQHMLAKPYEFESLSKVLAQLLKADSFP